MAVSLYRRLDDLGRMRLERLVHHQTRIDEATFDDVPGDAFGANLPGEFLDLGAGEHPHEAGRNALHAFDRVVGPGKCCFAPTLPSPGGGGKSLIADDLGDGRVGLIEIRIGELPRDAWQALDAGDFLDARLDPTAFVALGHAIENLLRLGGPFDLEAVEGDLFFDIPFPGGGGGNGGFIDPLETSPVANRAGVRLSAT